MQSLQQVRRWTKTQTRPEVIDNAVQALGKLAEHAEERVDHPGRCSARFYQEQLDGGAMCVQTGFTI